MLFHLDANENHSEQMILIDKSVCVVSKFAEIDYLTVFSSGGELLWEVAFNDDGLLIIFSKARNSMAYFLTCLNAKEGKLETVNEQSPLQID